MSEATVSQVQQNQDVWSKAVEENAARVEAAFGEAARLEAEGAAQLAACIEQMAKLQKDTLAYMTQLSTEWRRLSIEAMRRAASFGQVKG